MEWNIICVWFLFYLASTWNCFDPRQRADFLIILCEWCIMIWWKVTRNYTNSDLRFLLLYFKRKHKRVVCMPYKLWSIEPIYFRWVLLVFRKWENAYSRIGGDGIQVHWHEIISDFVVELLLEYLHTGALVLQEDDCVVLFSFGSWVTNTTF